MANMVTLTGNVGQAPTLRTAKNGNDFVTFSLATSRYYTDKGGERHEETTWHDLVLWGPSTEAFMKNVASGTRLLIVGRLVYNEDEKDGVRRRFVKVRVGTWEVQCRRRQDEEAKDGEPAVEAEGEPEAAEEEEAA